MTTSQTVTATIEFPFTNEDIELHIFGSGFMSWDWWHEFERSDWGYRIHAENPVNDNDFSRDCSYDDIRRTVGDILSGRVQCSLARQQLAFGNVDEMDLDADGADQLMQIVVFGEVVFG
jgi:hypothetical protein